MVNLSASVGDWIAMNFLMWERVLGTSFSSSGFSFTMEKAVSRPAGWELVLLKVWNFSNNFHNFLVRFG